MAKLFTSNKIALNTLNANLSIYFFFLFLSMTEEMEDTTPTNKNRSSRYSMHQSEYGTPIGDSDNSLYYSLIEDGEKENSTGKWSVSDSNAPMILRSSKKVTPLIQKVLHHNQTPRNKNNKRVSFSSSPKPMPMEEKIGKVHPKTPRRSKAIATSIGLEDCQERFRDVLTLNSNEKPIEASQLETISETISNDSASNDGSNNEVQSNTSAVSAAISDVASDVADDKDQSMMENTIIENWMRTVKQNGAIGIHQTNENIIESNEPMAMNVIQATSPGKNVIQATTPGKNVKPADQVLQQKMKTPQPKSRNVTLIARYKLANENRKTILPKPERKTILPKTDRKTTYRRRSSTYEPKRMDFRKSISVLKKVVRTVNKTIPGKVKCHSYLDFTEEKNYNSLINQTLVFCIQCLLANNQNEQPKSEMPNSSLQQKAENKPTTSSVFIKPTIAEGKISIEIYS